MSYADERRGYNRGHADGARVIGSLACAETAQALHNRFVNNGLVAQINTANALIQDMQARLQAADEYIKFVDRSNVELGHQLQELGTEAQDVWTKLQAWEAYGKTAQATMAQQRQAIEDQRKKIDTQEATIQELTDKLAYEYGF